MIARVRAFWRNVVRRRRADADLDDELRAAPAWRAASVDPIAALRQD
jgi:hypothetical protein